MLTDTLKTQAFKLKGRLYTLTVVQLLNTDPDCFEEQLSEVTSKAPKFFDNTPVVLDCSMLADEPFNLAYFRKSLSCYGMTLVAIQGEHPRFEALAKDLGLPLLHASAHLDKPRQEKKTDTPINVGEPIKTKLYTTHVRSGQQVVSKEGDLVIASSVSHGAEVLADGHIHIYGALRGRALAGIAGDKEARIFCQSLDAELVAIAGFYSLRDAMEPRQKPCQIFLRDEHICIEDL